MDLIHRDIKIRVKNCQEKIKEQQEELKFLRDKCTHPNFEEVNYEFGPGRIIPQTKICSICGEVIRK